MEYRQIALVLFGMILVSTILFGMFLTGLVTFDTDNADEREYSWTKAICNTENECMDAVIYCKGDKVQRIEPIFYVVKHDAGWVDPRTSQALCD